MPIVFCHHADGTALLPALSPVSRRLQDDTGRVVTLSAINGRPGSRRAECVNESGVWRTRSKLGGEVMQLRKTGPMTHACCY